MAETSIKISLELADKAAQKALSDFVSGTDKAGKSLDKLKNSGTSTFNEITVGIGKSIGIFEIFAGNLAANVVVGSFNAMSAAASSLFSTFIVDGVKAAQDAQDALNSLNVALAQSGIYSKKTSQDFVEFAEQLQATTTFEDDIIIKNAALLQSMAQLSEDGLKKATVAALDLSAGLNKDLSTATEALAKAANGNTTALQKMGFEIRKGNTDAETFANALKAVEERVGGAAASKVNTYSGAVAQASHAFGNLTEEIGNVIIKNPAVIQVINEVSNIFRELTDVTKQSSGAFTQLVGGGLSSFLSISAFVVSMADVLVRVFQTVYGVVQAVSVVILPLSYALTVLSDGFQAANEQIKKFGQDTTKNLTALGKSGDGVLAKMSEDLLRLKEASDRGMEALSTGAAKTVEPVNKTTAAVRGLSEETKRSNDRLRSFALDLVKQAESGKSEAEKAIETARLKSESEQAILQEQLDNNLISYYDYQTRRDAIDAEFDAARRDAELTKFSEDNERLATALKTKEITEAEYIAAKEQLNIQFQTNQIKREQDQLKRDAANKKAREKLEKEYHYAKLQATADVFNALATIAATGGKKNFEIVKAFNLAEAITAGILSIQKAAASAPPPFNIPAIVSATALSTANVVRIAATKAPSFEDGGIVPGSSFTGDRVSANVNSGEMILNRSQQATLFKMANGSGGSGLEAKLEQNNRLLGAIYGVLSEGTQINVDGKELINVLRGQLTSGRAFA